MITIGDIVRVRGNAKAISSQLLIPFWKVGMSETLGKEGFVKKVGSVDRIMVDFNSRRIRSYWYPVCALEQRVILDNGDELWIWPVVMK